MKTGLLRFGTWGGIYFAAITFINFEYLFTEQADGLNSILR